MIQLITLIGDCGDDGERITNEGFCGEKATNPIAIGIFITYPFILIPLTG